MTDYKPFKISLTDGQKSKIIDAVKKKTDVTIDTTKGNNSILLTERQINKINKNVKDGKGTRIKLTYKQLRENQKEGGILPLIFAGIGALAALAGGVSSITNSVIDKKYKDKLIEEQIRHNKEMEKKQGGNILTKKTKSKKKNNPFIEF